MAASAAPSLLEYARYHGLAVDHKTRDLLCDLSVTSECDTATKDDDHLRAFTLPVSEDFYQEAKFQLNSAARALLSHSIQPPDLPSWESVLPDHHRAQKLKIEQVLIHGDCHKTKWDCVVRQSLDLAYRAVQPEDLDEDHDVVLGFPPELLPLKEQWDTEVVQERLQTTKKVLERLRNNLQDHVPSDLYKDIIADSLPFKKKAFLEQTSPLLEPQGSNSLLNVSSTLMHNSSVTSVQAYTHSQNTTEDTRPLAEEDCSTLTGEAGGRLEEMKTELIEADTEDPEKAAASAPDLSYSRQTPVNDQKVQRLEFETFTPALDASTKLSPDKKTVVFAEILEEYIPDPTEVKGDPEFFDDRVKSSLSESAPQLHTGIVEDGTPVEHRKSSDVIQRVRVPELEAVALASSWQIIDTGKDDLLWPIIGELAVDTEADNEQISDQQLGRVPFPPRLAEVEFGEIIKAGAHSPHFVYSPEEIVQSSQLLWTAGLPILDDEEGGKGDDLLEEARAVAESQVPGKRSLDARPLEYPRKLLQTLFNNSSDISIKAFSASDSLSAFMGSRDRASQPLKRGVSHHLAARKQDLDATLNEVPRSLLQVPAIPKVELEPFTSDGNGKIKY